LRYISVADVITRRETFLGAWELRGECHEKEGVVEERSVLPPPAEEGFKATRKSGVE
jgi:hypothetical protein